MKKNLEKKLDALIAELHKGKSIEECLVQVEEHRSELEPLLEVAQVIERLPKPDPAPELVSATLVNVGGEAVRYRENKKSVFRGMMFHQPRIAWAIGVAFIMLFFFTGLTFISNNSIPGDFLYPAKLTTEKVNFFLSFDSERKAELRLRFSDERLREMVRVLERQGTLDKEILRRMLDEANLALEEGKRLPDQRAVLFQVRFDHFNAYQKETLERIRGKIPPTDQEAVDEAIETCRNRMQRMMQRMRGGRFRNMK